MSAPYLNLAKCRELCKGYTREQASASLPRAEARLPLLGTVDYASNVNWCRALQERIEELS